MQESSTSNLSARGFQVADTIKRIAQTRSVVRCKRRGLVINRVKGGDEEQVRRSAQEIGLETLACIPEDENIVRYDLMGRPIFDIEDDSPSVVAATEIVERLELLS